MDVIILLFGYLLVLVLPGFVIEMIFFRLRSSVGNEKSMKCGGLPSGGYLIGYAERTLIFLAFLISYFDGTLSYASILSFLSVIVAGKAIFRYSSRETNNRACADWYILGTFLSIAMALATTWWIFRFLLTG